MLPKPEIMSTPYMNNDITNSSSGKKCKEFASQVLTGVLTGILTSVITTVITGVPVPVFN